MSQIEENQAERPALSGSTHAEPAPAGALAPAVPIPAPNGVDGTKRSFLPALWSARQPLLLAGNKLRIVRGGLTALVGALVAFVLMSTEAQFRWGVPVGLIGILVASVGVL